MLWQAGGLAWLRGNAARAEELTTEAYELYRRVTPHAAARLRRAPVHAAPRRPPAGPAPSRCWWRPATRAARCCRRWRCWPRPSPATCAEARRLRARWGRTLIRDWASDVAVLLQAESALRLGDEPEWASAAASLLPYRGRQAVLGTPAFSLGSYDELLGRIAERRGDPAAARQWWQGARGQGGAGRLAAPGGGRGLLPRPASQRHGRSDRPRGAVPLLSAPEGAGSLPRASLAPMIETGSADRAPGTTAAMGATSEVGRLRTVLLHRPGRRAAPADPPQQRPAALRRRPVGGPRAGGARRLRRRAAPRAASRSCTSTDCSPRPWPSPPRAPS